MLGKFGKGFATAEQKTLFKFGKGLLLLSND